MKENFFSIVPIKGEFFVREHHVRNEKTEYIQIFPSQDKAEEFIEERRIENRREGQAA